jgi:hypothetical protein
VNAFALTFADWMPTRSVPLTGPLPGGRMAPDHGRPEYAAGGRKPFELPDMTTLALSSHQARDYATRG